jgi:hypothetical protein
LRADCQGEIPVVANRGTIESRLPRGYSCCGKPRMKSSTSHSTSDLAGVKKIIRYHFCLPDFIPKIVRFFTISQVYYYCLFVFRIIQVYTL